jgi:alpha-amylase/alpha-mannosidase (GH57 family)
MLLMADNEKSTVIFILHAYQPITQSKEVLERIIEKCYKPFFEKLLDNSSVKISLNIAGCLLEKLTMEYPEIVKLIEKAKDNNQIELMGSAFYHPILPLTRQEDQAYQIKKQNIAVAGIFGKTPTAFFPPELALNPENIPIIINEGFKIMISAANSLNVTYGGIYQLDNGEEIFILKRNKIISNRISFDYYKRDATKLENEVSLTQKLDKLPVVLAMDLETFGEHHSNYYNFFFEIANKVSTITLTEFQINYNISTPIDFLYFTSWSTSDEDYQKQNHLPLWNHPNNPVHQLLLEHMKLLEKVKEKIDSVLWVDDYQAAHYSCQLWWASGLKMELGFYREELVLVGLNYQRLVLDSMANELEDDLKQMILKESDEIIQKIEQILTNVGK